MLSYIVRRSLYMVVVLLAVSVVAFIVIQLPPGDYLTTLVDELKARGLVVGEEQIRSLEQQYGLDLPLYAQYFKWMWDMLHGDFGRSFEWNQPVSRLIGERLPLTITISLITLLFVYAVSVPIGIYSATHQYSIGDYAFTMVIIYLPNPAAGGGRYQRNRGTSRTMCTGAFAGYLGRPCLQRAHRRLRRASRGDRMRRGCPNNYTMGSKWGNQMSERR